MSAVGMYRSWLARDEGFRYGLRVVLGGVVSRSWRWLGTVRRWG
jgi:hypothetical protein